MIVDFIRYEYRRACRFYAGQTVPTDIVWRRALPGAGYLDKPTVFWSLTTFKQEGNVNDPGELTDIPAKYSRSAVQIKPVQPGLHSLGTDADFMGEGIPTAAALDLAADLPANECEGNPALGLLGGIDPFWIDGQGVVGLLGGMVPFSTTYTGTVGLLGSMPFGIDSTSPGVLGLLGGHSPIPASPGVLGLLGGHSPIPASPGVLGLLGGHSPIPASPGVLGLLGGHSPIPASPGVLGLLGGHSPIPASPGVLGLLGGSSPSSSSHPALPLGFRFDAALQSVAPVIHPFGLGFAVRPGLSPIYPAIYTLPLGFGFGVGLPPAGYYVGVLQVPFKFDFGLLAKGPTRPILQVPFKMDFGLLASHPALPILQVPFKFDLVDLLGPPASADMLEVIVPCVSHPIPKQLRWTLSIDYGGPVDAPTTGILTFNPGSQTWAWNGVTPGGWVCVVQMACGLDPTSGGMGASIVSVQTNTFQPLAYTTLSAGPPFHAVFSGFTYLAAPGGLPTSCTLTITSL